MVREQTSTHESDYERLSAIRVILREASYEEYLATAPDSLISEWANGEMIIYAPSLTSHAALVEFLVQSLGLFVDVMKLGRLMVAPFEVKLENASREPDIAFISNDNLVHLDGKRFTGAPDFVIEVVSTESAHRDRVDKFDEYEAVGVREYWILDNRPGRDRAQFYQLGADARYHAVEPDALGVYRSRELPDFWLDVSWLWQEFPDALRAIARVIGPERMAEALRRAAE